MDTINQRIDIIINELKLTNKEFGSFLGVTEATARNLRKEGVVKEIYIETISNKWNYNKKWIEDGSGDKYKSSSNKSVHSSKDLMDIANDSIDNWEELMKIDKFKSHYYLQLTKTLNIDLEEIIERALSK